MSSIFINLYIFEKLFQWIFFHIYSKFTLDLLPDINFKQNLLFVGACYFFKVIFIGVIFKGIDLTLLVREDTHMQLKLTSVINPNVTETLRMEWNI